MSEMSVRDPSTYARFEDLCMDLNIDKPTKILAWEEFSKISINFTLEGDSLLWLVCSLYFNCRRNYRNKVALVNCVSLTRLLRSAKQRVGFVFPRRRVLNAKEPEAEKWKYILTQFFDKMQKWADMASLPVDLIWKIKKLERNFNVSTVLFQKMRPLFSAVFKMDCEPREKRKRKTLCSSGDLYIFCWTTYVFVKSNYPGVSHDLVNSFHLLLCCLDWLFMDCVLEKRTDVLNSNFPPLKEITDLENVPESVCVLDYLCGNTDGIAMEAKVIRQHYWKPLIESLAKRKLLRCRTYQKSGFLDITNFDTNLKSMNLAYEEHLMTVGDFDERIFLGEQEFSSSVTRKDIHGFVDGDSHSSLEALTSNFYWKNGRLASHNLIKLLHLLKNRKAEPSENLIVIIRGIEVKLVPEMESRVEEYGRIYVLEYAENDNFCDYSVQIRNEYTKMLYYRLLENIMVSELRRLAGRKVNFSELLNQEIFHRALFACAWEMVMFALDSKTDIQQLLRRYDLTPFQFYKVIESIVKTEADLSRATIRHLNWLEEEILDSLAWKEHSSLWSMVAENSVPTCEQVTFASHLEKEGEVKNNTTPSTLNDMVGAIQLGQSVPNPKRRLFTTSLTAPSGNKILTTQQVQLAAPMKPGEPETKTFTFQTVVGEDGRQVLIPVQLVPIRKPDRPQRRGPLAIFFRKFYHLASVRLRALCDRLAIDNPLRARIWTILEYCLVKNIDLMKDRHLDQLILCSVYIICRVDDVQLTQFQEIVNAYKWQPQARSSIYRNVLIKRNGELVEVNKGNDLEDLIRGDLIQFYNEIFVHKMKKFALKFCSKNGDLCPPITALPMVRGLKVPSRKLSAHHSVYVSPIKEGCERDLCTKLRYRFDEGYSCDLHFINKIIQKMTAPLKRPFQDENGNETLADDVRFLKRIRTTEAPMEASLHGIVSMPILRQKLLGLVRDRHSHGEVVPVI